MKNVIWLAVIQVSNALVPLVAIPYVWSVCGAEIASVVAVTEAIAAIVLIISIYSFDLTGVRDILSVEHNSELANRTVSKSHLYWNIFYTRTVLFIISSLIACSATFIFKGEEYLWVLLGWLLYPLGYILFGYWRQQALAQNKLAAIFTLLGRTSGLILIVALLDTETTGGSITSVLSGSYAIGSIAFFGSLIHSNQVSGPTPVRLSVIQNQLNKGKEVFTSSLSVILYRGLNVIILEAVGLPAAGVTAYAVAEKTVKVLQASVRPLNQHYIAVISKSLLHFDKANLFSYNAIKNSASKQIYTVMGIVIIGYIGIGVAIASQQYYDFKLDATTINLVAIMLLTIIAGVYSYQYGSIGLNQLNGRTILLRLSLAVGITNILGCYLLANLLGVYGAAIAYLLAEWVLYLCIIRVYKVSS